MARDLRADLQAKLGLSTSQVNKRIAARENERLLTRRLAMLSLAHDANMPLRRYAQDDEITELRSLDRAMGSTAAAPTVTTPLPAKSTVKRVARASRGSPEPVPPKPKNRRKVFVVHGRDTALATELFSFLRSLDLNPIEWSEAKKLTGSAQPSIPEILDAAFREAAAVVVLLTPDDLVILKQEFRKRGDPPYEKRQTGQARPNVLFEAGLAFGRHPKATILVRIGDVKPFTDVGGLYIIRLDDTPEKRTELVDSLRIAGAAVNIDGKTAWYRAGKFSIEEGK